ncbi:MAG: hypothetical protein DME85_04395 [Verrucomicrobia bacterium]|nr:MAG: hypothetical protein DME85_04395 [Verrucomicrobiota bacterium]
MKQNLQNPGDISRNIELRRTLPVCQSCCDAPIRLRPKLNGITQRDQVVRGIYNGAVHSIVDSFAKAIIARCNHWQPARERFQTRIRRRIINCRQNENVCGGINTHQIAHFAQELDALCFVIALPPSTGDEQTHFAVPAQRHGSDGKLQTLASPA